jgi:hypothetical protein
MSERSSLELHPRLQETQSRTRFFAERFPDPGTGASLVRHEVLASIDR